LPTSKKMKRRFAMNPYYPTPLLSAQPAERLTVRPDDDVISNAQPF
jgi:hypothetical protein